MSLRWKQPTQAQLCGPAFAGRSCSRLGECCSASGECGAAACGDPARRAAFDAPPTVQCPSRVPFEDLPPCEQAAAAVTMSEGVRCGPAANAMCPWQRGVDLCCIQHVGAPKGEGRCRACAGLDAEERARVLLWSGASKRWLR